MPFKDPEKRRASRRKLYVRKRDHVLKQERKYKEQNPDAFESRKLKTRYGITLDQFKAMREAQENRCAICCDEFKPTRIKRSIHIDHCHATQVVRGLLCARCNVGIGLLNDSIDRMKAAIEYLQRSKS